jgi:hypothetical protein
MTNKEAGNSKCKDNRRSFDFAQEDIVFGGCRGQVGDVGETRRISLSPLSVFFSQSKETIISTEAVHGLIVSSAG